MLELIEGMRSCIRIPSIVLLYPHINMLGRNMNYDVNIKALRELLANNDDGHLSIHECFVIRETIENLEVLLKRVKAAEGIE